MNRIIFLPLLYFLPLIPVLSAQDAVPAVQADNGIRYAAVFDGATGGAKVAAAFANLPPGGGIVDAMSMGDQTLSQNMFAGVGGPTQHITLLTGCGTWTYAVKQEIPANVTIRDLGRCTTFKQASGTNLNVSFETVANADNVHLEGFTLDGNARFNTGVGQEALLKLTATSTNSSVKGVTVQNFYGLTGATGVCLFVSTAVNTLLEGNTIRDCGGTGHVSDAVYTSGTRNRIVNNYIAGCTDTGIAAETSIDPVITGNTIVGCPQGIAADSAIATTTGTGAIIANNVITGAGVATNGGAIWVFQGAGTGQTRVVIAGNIIKGTANSRGILVEKTHYVDITGNIVTDTTIFDGIRVAGSDNVTIAGNTSNLAGAHGFYIDTCTNVLLSGNTANDNSGNTTGVNAGFFLNGGANILISGNQAHDTRGGSARQARGLMIVGAADNVFVTGNDFRFNQAEPGYLNSSSGNVRLGYNMTAAVDNTPEAIDYLRISELLQLDKGKKFILKGSASAADPYIWISSDELQFRLPNSGVRFVENGGTDTRLLITSAGTVQIGENSGSSGGGVATDGGGLKHGRSSSCTTGTRAGNTCDTVVTWTTPFADANYTANCTLQGAENVVVSYKAKTADTLTVRLKTISAGAANGILHCIAMHD